MENIQNDSSLSEIYIEQLENLKQIFNADLFNIGEIASEEYDGIFSPLYDRDHIKRYMTEHYSTKESALSQAESFDLTDYYYSLISDGLKKVNFTSDFNESKIKILDIGCGFGSTTIPLLKIFPESEVIASELSIEMLSVLKNKLVSTDIMRRCTLMQLDAESLNFKDNSFSLIVGAAILHHLFNPEKVFESIIRILKPGCCAIFFEPFENGMSIMGLIYQSIITNKRFKLLKRHYKNYFKSSVNYWQNMKNIDKQDLFFKDKDDKWIFTKTYFNNIFETYKFREYKIYPIECSDKPFLAQAEAHFKGNGITSLPRWIYDIIDNYEKWFSRELKQDFLTEGVIIVKK